MSASTPGSLAWFAQHELRLAWRDAIMMMQGGRRGRGIGALIAFLVFEIVLHAIAYGALKGSVGGIAHPDKAMLLAITGAAGLGWTLLFSQAMETVTRSFYARADLDLILSSPAPARRLFAVRIGANAATTVAMAAFLAGPVVDVAFVFSGPGLLLGYGVLVAMGASALAAATLATLLLFRLAGPKHTRLLAQIVAAIVGAGFVVGIQAAAILSFGTLSRTLMFQSPAWIAAAPDLASPLWWPARAATGNGGLAILLLALSLGLLVATIAMASPAFARDAMIVSGLPTGRRTVGKAARFRPVSQRGALRSKEWTLLWRDPWLVSQSLMQVLYLLPPALLLWRDFAADGDGLVVLVPVLVMAAGQLGGGLAWLAISGEDAPDLVATAPITPHAIVRAKVEAVMIAVALPILPIAGGMAFAVPRAAGITVGGAALAAAGATMVQLLFRSQAKRSNFRRRQTSSRLATFAEAFVSIAIAGAAGLAAAGWWLAALAPAAVALLVLGACRALTGDRRET